MLLENILPQLPGSPSATLIYIVAILGGIMLVYSQFVEAENRRDLIRIIGSSAMLVYALYIQNVLFSIVMFAIAVAALVEFIEIYLGYHKHTRQDVDVYKYIGRKKKK